MLTIEKLMLERGGKAVLHGVDLQVRPGEITALVGANGAGKSSLVMAIAGELPRLSGTIRADGRNLAGLRPEAVRAAGVAVIPEGHRVLGDLSVMDNLRVAATHLSARQAHAAIERVLDILPELTPKLDSAGRALSGGQKQMVCIAQALLAEPRYLLIDELSLGLAPTILKRLAGVIRDIVERQRTGILLVEQFTTLALDLSTQASILVRGKMAWSGLSRELIERPDILRSSYLVQ